MKDVSAVLEPSFMADIDRALTPLGATHVGEFYGTITYYKKSEYDHLNQVSEEWEARHKWYYWENEKWIWVGIGFSDRRLVLLQK